MFPRLTAGLGALLAATIFVTGCGGSAAPPAEPSGAERGTQATASTGSATEVAPGYLLPASAPVRVQIPAIGVDSPLIGLGLRPDGTMQVPSAGFPAGWFTGAPTPGELGPSIIAGHVDWAGEPGVFYRLRDLAAGDEVTVQRTDGSVAVFRVTRMEQFPKDEFPTELVYGDLDFAGLRLITCGGSFDRGERSYVDNIVVFAELVPSPPA